MLTSYHSLAAHRWTHARITGRGPYAVLAPCHGIATVSLWPTRETANRRLDFLAGGCGGHCLPGLHEVVCLDVER